MSSLMDDANVAVRRLVRAALGLGENDVKPSPQRGDAGSQATPFATVLIMDDDALGQPSSAMEPDGHGGWLDAVYVPERITASVQFYKSTPKAGYLRGAAASSTIGDYTGVVNGGFDVKVDSTLRQVTALDFSGAVDLPGVAAVVQSALAALAAGTTVTWNGRRFVVTSPTTGQSSAVGFAVAPTGAGAPVDAGTLLALTQAAGAVAKSNATGIADYSNEAFDRARRLPLLLRLAANVEMMQTMGLGFERSSKARNLAGLTDATWESRGSVDLTFNIISREALAVAAVENASIGLSVQQPDGVIQTRTIEVST